MFAWLTRMFGGGAAAAPKAASRVAAHTTAAKPAAFRAQADNHNTTANSNADKTGAQRKSDDGYIATLSKELGDPFSLSGEEEQRVSQLVEDISKYVSTHSIEPPVMPAIASRMLELLRADEVDVVALARLIEKDQATAAKLLSIANSAAFKGATEIEGIRDAVVFLGTEQVAHIAIGLATRAMFESPKHQTKVVGQVRFTRLFNHAMTTAFSACQIASRRTRRHSEASFVGGLFHDVGKAVALRALTEVLAEKHQPAPSEAVIDSALQLIHSEPNAPLYETWSLPRQVMLMVQNHHHLTADVPQELHVVRLVSGLDTLRAGSAIEKRDVLQEIAESAAALKMTDAELRVAHTETKEYGERVMKMFG